MGPLMFTLLQTLRSMSIASNITLLEDHRFASLEYISDDEDFSWSYGRRVFTQGNMQGLSTWLLLSPRPPQRWRKPPASYMFPMYVNKRKSCGTQVFWFWLFLGWSGRMPFSDDCTTPTSYCGISIHNCELRLSNTAGLWSMWEDNLFMREVSPQTYN